MTIAYMYVYHNQFLYQVTLTTKVISHIIHAEYINKIVVYKKVPSTKKVQTEIILFLASLYIHNIRTKSLR